jgi:hypothetical protein
MSSRVNRPRLHSRHAISEKLNGIFGLSVPPEPEFALEIPVKRRRLQDENPARLALPLRIVLRATALPHDENRHRTSGPQSESMDGDSRPGLSLLRDFYSKMIPPSRAKLG